MSWLSGWAKRIKITIDADLIDAALSDFPVPVYISTASGIGDVDASCVFDELTSDANRKKIAVTTSDGETQCYVEIERWDHASEKAWLHVGGPAISDSVDTDFYLYYDSTQADNSTYVGDTGDAAAQAVWDSNFVGVWHMGQDPTGGAGCILDSTDNGQHMTPAGSMTSGDLVDALFGKGLDFDGVDDYISVAAGKIRLGTDKTIMCLIKPASTDPMVLWSVDALGDYGEGGFSGDLLMWRDSILKNKDYLYADPSVFFDVGVWYCIELTVINSGRPAKLYNAGELNGESTRGTIYGPEDIRRFAFTPTTGDRKHFKGVACELRCSGVARSDAWIKATYHGLFDSLLTFGAEENLGETILQVGNEGEIRVLPQAPAEFQWDISGTVKESGAPVARTVRLYKRSNGELVDETVSDAGDGAYSFEGCPPEVCYVVALDDDSGDVFNALILDRVKPGQDFS